MGTARLRRTWSESVKLTKREMEVLRCAAEGLSRDETAAQFFLADSTIHRHRTNIFRKLDAKTLAHAVAIGYQRKLFDLPKVPEEIVVGGVRYSQVKEG